MLIDQDMFSRKCWKKLDLQQKSLLESQLTEMLKYLWGLNLVNGVQVKALSMSNILMGQPNVQVILFSQDKTSFNSFQIKKKIN